MALQPLTLADLQLSRAAVDDQRRFTAEVLRTINGNNRNIKQIVNALADQLVQIQTALDLAGIAIDQSEASIRELARINSYPSPSNNLTAEDAGSDATITITGHTRIYPVQGAYDVPDLAVSGGSLTGLSYSTVYDVYYDDVTLADTTPAYIATTNLALAQPGAAAGRHFVGRITTPAAGGGDTGGTGGSPPGGGGGINNPIP